MDDEVHISKAENLIQQLNVANAKKVAVLLILGFIGYHGLIHLQYGADSCKWLLSDGRFKGDREWQPYGCMMHKYSLTDTRRCFRYLAFWGNQNNFIFIGDARIRALYQSFLLHVSPSDDDNMSVATSTELKKNLEFVDYKLRLRVAYIYAPEISQSIIEQFVKWQYDEDPPSAIVISCTSAGFLLGNLTEDVLNKYLLNLTRLVLPIDVLIEKKSKVLWKLQDNVDQEHLTDEWKNVQNSDIDKLNQIVSDIFRDSNVHIWASSKSIANGLLAESENGWQLSPLALQHDIQILLNMYCNDYMNYNDGSCCSSAEPNTILQIITYSILGICVVLSLGMLIRRWIMRLRGHTFYVQLNQNTSQSNKITEIGPPIFALAKLAVIMAYFYLCDRTNFFMKENKYYSEFSFWIPLAYVFALGLFFTENTKYSKVLHRDQTDELKGWMQIVILIYHMTGADQVLPIYMHIKVLISTYLFLSGYSQFTYMWQTGNTGLIRFLQILFRFNFVTVLLCLCMNRPYQFYYFVPLISFWFCMIYFILAIPPHITLHDIDNNPYRYFSIVLKFICLVSVITILFMSEVFFEKIFVTRPWKALFVTTDDDIHEWWHRWKLDRYTITFGMAFALLFHTAQKYNLIDDNNHGNLFSKRISLTATLAAIIGIGFYTTFSFLCRSRYDCEEIHSYVIFIPIVGYIVLRNISGVLRTHYSPFFAWFGRISLELFICQYHIWLAADRHGVLVLLPGFPNLNIIISSFIFVCVSHEVNRLTQVLLPYAVPNDWKLALRNLVIFLVILVPIGRYDGML